jgi:hypothetical protein
MKFEYYLYVCVSARLKDPWRLVWRHILHTPKYKATPYFYSEKIKNNFYQVVSRITARNYFLHISFNDPKIEESSFLSSRIWEKISPDIRDDTVIVISTVGP